MSLSKETFDDHELDSLAIEIIKDLSTKPQIDPNDAFICKLAEEIEIEILNLYDIPSSSNYTDTSLLPPSSSSSSTQIHICYPSAAMSPTIVYRRQLSPDDSLNQSFPPIPSPKSNTSSHYRFPSYKKRPVSTYNYKKRYKTDSFSPNTYQSPRYHAPPHISLAHNISKSSDYTISETIISNISSCISPRNRTPKSRTSVIPDFTDAVPLPLHRAKRKKKRMKKKSFKVIAPISVDTTYNHKEQKRSVTPTARAKKRIRHTRSVKSNVLTRNELEQYNEYAVEVDDGFIFINSPNVLNDVV